MISAGDMQGPIPRLKRELCLELSQDNTYYVTAGAREDKQQSSHREKDDRSALKYPETNMLQHR